MCGIAGWIDPEADEERGRSELLSMAEALSHRGPDDQGFWLDPASGIGLAHRRLSILDLSSLGAQPMHSSSRRYVISYNGEIYNTRAIREELMGQGVLLRGHSDTEALVALIETRGLDQALRTIEGMFAFALWDKREKTLTLARDRLGEKPLYYGWSGGVFLFASELKALRAHSKWNGTVSSKAVSLYAAKQCISAPLSIYENIYKLLPGTSLTVRHTEYRKPSDFSPSARPSAFWSAFEIAVREKRASWSEAEALERFESLFDEVVKKEMISDVPYGAFLSGGIDSSLVVALMAKHTSKPVRTFTIGFDDPDYDESRYSRQVAEHLGTDHTQAVIRPLEAIEATQRMPQIYDEPFSDSSQVPTYLVSRLASSHVKVALSGDGADELFGGYHRHIWGEKAMRISRWIPGAARGVLRSGVLNALIPVRYPQHKIEKLLDLAGVSSSDELYEQLSGYGAATGLLEDRGKQNNASANQDNFADLTGTEKMMLLDQIGYLPDDILTKIDRASMAVSLETRAPFLHHSVVEFSWQLHMSMKIRGTQGKRILRKFLGTQLPDALFDRPKAGLTLPLGPWLMGPLKEWASHYVSEEMVRKYGFYSPDRVTALWNEHLSGRAHREYPLWNVIVFHAWMEANSG